MHSQHTFIATPKGILMNGSLLAKSASRKLSPHELGYIRRANELLKHVTQEEWDMPTAPHTTDNIPVLAKVTMLLALASPRAFGKYSPDQPRVPAGNGKESGQWTSGDDSSSMTHDDYVNRKQKFVDAHLAATETAAKQLNVPVENLLGIAALESQWGTSRFAEDGNNYFGLYYPAPYGIPNDYITAAGNPNARMATFNSYEDSLNSFVYSNINLIQGKSDPVDFMTSLQNSGKFGINTTTGENMPTYVQDAAATIRGLRPVIANSRAGSGQ